MENEEGKYKLGTPPDLHSLEFWNWCTQRKDSHSVRKESSITSRVIKKGVKLKMRDTDVKFRRILEAKNELLLASLTLPRTSPKAGIRARNATATDS